MSFLISIPGEKTWPLIECPHWNCKYYHRLAKLVLQFVEEHRCWEYMILESKMNFDHFMKMHFRFFCQVYGNRFLLLRKLSLVVCAFCDHGINCNMYGNMYGSPDEKEEWEYYKRMTYYLYKWACFQVCLRDSEHHSDFVNSFELMFAQEITNTHGSADYLEKEYFD